MTAKEKIKAAIAAMESEIGLLGDLKDRKDLIEMLAKLRAAAYGGDGLKIADQTAGATSPINKMVAVKVPAPGIGARLLICSCYYGYDLAPLVPGTLKIEPQQLNSFTVSASVAGARTLPINLLLPENCQCLFTLTAGGANNVGRIGITYSVL